MIVGDILFGVKGVDEHVAQIQQRVESILGYVDVTGILGQVDVQR